MNLLLSIPSWIRIGADLIIIGCGIYLTITLIFEIRSRRDRSKKAATPQEGKSIRADSRNGLIRGLPVSEQILVLPPRISRTEHAIEDPVLVAHLQRDLLADRGGDQQLSAGAQDAVAELLVKVGRAGVAAFNNSGYPVIARPTLIVVRRNGLKFTHKESADSLSLLEGVYGQSLNVVDVLHEPVSECGAVPGTYFFHFAPVGGGDQASDELAVGDGCEALCAHTELLVHADWWDKDLFAGWEDSIQEAFQALAIHVLVYPLDSNTAHAGNGSAGVK